MHGLCKGTYQDQVGKLQCKNCPAGTFRYASLPYDGKDWNGDDDGESGGVGYRHVADSFRKCIVCPSGKYQQHEGQTGCADCPSGTFRAASHGYDSLPWDGYVGVNSNRRVAEAGSNCTVCPSGQYQEETSKTSCIKCPPGTKRPVSSSDDSMAWNGLNPSINQKVVISSITSFGGMSQVSIEAKYAIDESLSHQFVSDYGEMSGFTFTTNGSYCNKLRIYSGDYAERDPTELEIFGSNAFAKPGVMGEWVFIGKVPIPPFSARRAPQILHIGANISFTHYKLNFTTLNGPDKSKLQIAELHMISNELFYGAHAYYYYGIGNCYANGHANELRSGTVRFDIDSATTSLHSDTFTKWLALARGECDLTNSCEFLSLADNGNYTLYTSCNHASMDSNSIYYHGQRIDFDTVYLGGNSASYGEFYRQQSGHPDKSVTEAECGSITNYQNSIASANVPSGCIISDAGIYFFNTNHNQNACYSDGNHSCIQKTSAMANNKFPITYKKVKLEGTGDRIVADEKGDCEVCESGKYQNEESNVECKECPAGTIRRQTYSDSKRWDGHNANRVNLARTRKCFGPSHCTTNNVCVGFEKDSRIYCYGSYDGCFLPSQLDCLSDDDCMKYTINSPKYANSSATSCFDVEHGWQHEACACIAEITASAVATGGEVMRAVDGDHDNGEYHNGACARTHNEHSWIKIQFSASMPISEIYLVGRNNPNDPDHYEQSSGWMIKIGEAGDHTDRTYAYNVSAYWSTAHPGVRLHFTDAVGKYVQILSKDWIVLCEIEVYGEIYDPLPLSSQCPKLYPYAYRPNNNLDRCCASTNDKHGNVGINAIHNKGKRSSSCQNNKYVSCLSPPCSDYGMVSSLVGNPNVADKAKDCTTCSSGQYQDLNGKTGCKSCPRGTKRVRNAGRDDRDGIINGF